MEKVSRTHGWNLLKRQFAALAHGEGVHAESIETIFDMEFRSRFSELINRTAINRSKDNTFWRFPRPS
jgi:hypothetical protein